MAPPEERAVDRQERGVREALHDGPGRPHHLYGRDRPRIVRDRIREDEPLHPVRVTDGGDLDDPAPEVVPDEDGPLQPDSAHPRDEVVGLGTDGDVAAAAFVDGAPVPDHLPGQAPGTLDARDDVAPEPGARRDPVDEDDGASVPGLLPAHRGPVHVYALPLHRVMGQAGGPVVRGEGQPRSGQRGPAPHGGSVAGAGGRRPRARCQKGRARASSGRAPSAPP